MLEPLELLVYDGYVRLRAPALSPTRVVLVEITEQDIKDQGHWPLSDAVLAELLRKLDTYQPRAIGLDIYRDVEVAPGHEQLEAELKRQSHIVAVQKMKIGQRQGIDPPQVLKGTDQVGFSDMIVDPGGTVRRGVLMMDDGHNGAAFSLALRLSLRYLQAENIYPQAAPQNPFWMRLGPTTLRPFAPNDGSYIRADAGGYQVLLDFRDSRDTFPTYSLGEVLTDQIDPAVIQDKIVIIGVTAESVKDFFYTPHSQGFMGQQHMAGIVLHAHMINQLLRVAHGETPSATIVNDTMEWVGIALWSGLGVLLGYRVRSPWLLSLCATGGVSLLGMLGWIAFYHHVWLPVLPPALAWGLSIAAITTAISRQEKQQKTFLMEQFSLYVSREVAEEIWLQRDHLLYDGRLRPQEMVVSVLFTDLVGFTPVTECMKANPQDLVNWLNMYMQSMTPHVVDNGGVILRFIGDAMMAVFGVPLKRTMEAEQRLDAVNAVTCALEMEQTLIQLNQRWQDEQLPTIGMRVGIFTGTVVAGSIGGRQRLEYNIHGDTVNTASRLESYEKSNFIPDFNIHPCRILIGETTHQYIEGEFQTKRLGDISLKGKQETVKVYKVVGNNE